jgi:hypothetical protein
MSGYYAAIGNDGSKIVVWGVGLTEEAALESGKRSVASEGRKFKVKVTPINDTHYKLIASSEVMYPNWAAVRALSNACDALIRSWGDAHVGHGDLTCRVTHSDNDDDLVNELVKIRKIVKKYRCKADWTGDANGDEWGVSITYVGNS